MLRCLTVDGSVRQTVRIIKFPVIFRFINLLGQFVAQTKRFVLRNRGREFEGNRNLSPGQTRTIVKKGAIIMKNYRQELWMNVPARMDFINITGEVQRAVDNSGIKEGLVLVNAMHITASVFINDDESGLHHDYKTWLEKLAPHEPVSEYRHNVGEDNADAHMKRQIMGREVVVAVSGGRLDFGTWERIFYGEFDGRRKKRVLIKIIGE